MNDEKQITADGEALVHITITLKDGTVADSTKVNAVPSIVRLGDDSLSETIQQNLIGLKAGDCKKFEVSPEQGFGLPNPANIHTLNKTDFPDTIKLQAGIIVEFEQMNGQAMPGTIRNVEDDKVTVDFNHPLCGQDLLFEVEVVEVF